MGTKKKGQEQEQIVSAVSTAVSAPVNVFKTLFGDVEQTSTLFSDSNPFKRKPEDAQLISQQPEAPEPEAMPKKSKKVKTQKPKPIEKTYSDSKNKKKRKRDDVEKEYEAKIYGVGDKEGNVNEDSLNVVVGEKRKKKENAEVIEKDEGFDDEAKLLRTIFVGNLPLKMKKKILLKEFSQFGEIESVRIRSVPIVDTKIPRKGAVILKKINDSADSVHAYIVFKAEESIEAALAHNMSVVGGNHIRVDRACPPRKKLKGEDSSLYDNRRTLFIGNLPFDVKDEEIYQLFCGIKDLKSNVEAVRVIRDTHLGLGKGIAYVLFKTREAANLALKKRNLKIRDRELRLSHAKKDSTSTPKTTPTKRKNPFSGKADTPTKKFSANSRTPNSKNVSNTKASLSYQGLRASKPGVQKKLHPKHNVVGKTKSNTQTGEKRNEKRPAVAARKATTSKNVTAVKHTGQKRKLDVSTPESSMRKKAKRFRK